MFLRLRLTDFYQYLCIRNNSWSHKKGSIKFSFIISMHFYPRFILNNTIIIKNSPEWYSSINIILIIISNTSLLNLGPVNSSNNHISVMYHNAQGLIPLSNLADKCPNLDITKIYALKSHIATNKPDVIILN